VTLPSLRPIGARVAAARELPLRAAVIVGLVLLAYNYSLITLARGLTLQTPLAYLALVPVMALGLAAARLRIEPRGLPIHDRQLDWIVGIGLLGIAAAVLILLPEPTSSRFWLQRIDLLTLPLFVAGLIALLFGVRRVWSLKEPIAFLLLAWPVPYTLFLSGVAGQFTEFTAHLVAAFTRVAPIAQPAPGDDTLFFVGSGVNAFSVSIGSACAGVNSFIGFLLIGTALLFVVRGPAVRRAAWLSVGLGLIFGLNVIRIIAILAVGARFGQAAALDILHPLAGLLVFNVGVLAMVALVPRFGLRFIGPSDRPGPNDPGVSNPVRRTRPALVVAVCLAGILAVTNAAYARFDAISSGLGDARLGSFDVRALQLPGWESKFIAAFPQARQYFGSSATWDRLSYWSTSGAQLASTRSVYVDVITTDDPGSLADYGLEECYRFHGYRIASVTTADIGAGVQAQIIDYVNTKVGADWSALWWEWPYSSAGRTRYERVVILLGEGPKSEFKGVTADDVETQVARFTDTDRFLATIGRAIVRSQLGTASR
jgi:exosortase/archaeosortase family protein